MFHSFDIDLAKTYGVNEAILLYNIAFWVAKNTANKQNFFEGRYWTFNSVKAYSDLFPYLSASTIKRALKHLKDAGIILTGNFNNDQHNRTYFYSLTDKGMALVSNRAVPLGQNDTMEQVKMDKPIFNNNTDSTDINNTDINNIYIPPISPLENLFEEFWKAYPRKVNKKGCRQKFIKIKNLSDIFPDIMAALECQKKSKQWNEENGKYIPHPETWINQERWNDSNDLTERQQVANNILMNNLGNFFKENE